MLTSQDIVTAYKLVLGREPESASVVENYIKHSDFEQLRRTLLSSGEFAEKLVRDPQLLGLSMATLTMTDEVRRYQDLLEMLVGLGLPIRDQSVLIIGDEAANLAGFFLERQCKVSIAASAQTADFLGKSFAVRRFHSANIAFVSHDFYDAIDDDLLGRFDLVYGQLPDESSDIMRIWLDNVAEACAGTLLVAGATAPGRSEDIFVTPSQLASGRFRTVATARWIFARLRERFEHVYRPTHAVEGPSRQTGPVGQTERQATYVASRPSLSLATLTEYVADAVPSQSSANGALKRA